MARPFLRWVRAHRLGVATLVFGLASMVLAAWGLYTDPAFAAAVAQDGTWAAWTDLLLEAAKMPALSQPADPPTNATFGWARVVGLLFAGLAVVTLLAELSEAVRQGIARRWRLGRSALAVRWRGAARGHVVVVGVGHVGRRVVRDARAVGLQVIAVAADAGTPGISEARQAGALVLVGDVGGEDLRRRLGLGYASRVVVATGDEARNVSVGVDLAEHVGHRRHPLTVHVHVDDPPLADDLAEDGPLAEVGGPDVDVEVFNLQERAARDLLLATNYAAPTPGAVYERGLARGRFAPGEDEVAHWVVVGFGPVGQTVALQAARLAHFRNRRRLRLTLADDFGGDGRPGDPEAVRQRTRFVERHPGFGPDPEAFDMLKHAALADRSAVQGGPDLDGWAASEWRPADPDWRTRTAAENAIEYALHAEYFDLGDRVDAPRVARAFAERFSRRGRPVRPAVIVCFEDERRTFRAVLALQRMLGQEAEAGRLTAAEVPIFAYLPTEVGLAEALESSAGRDGAFPVVPFGRFAEGELLEWVARPNLRDMARAVHEAYRSSVDGDVPAYDALSAPLRRSNEDAAAHVDVKLDAVGLYRRALRSGESPEVPIAPEDAGVLSTMEHGRYLGERLAAGWRYGPKPTDGRDTRQRPSFIPWDDLPEHEKHKDEEQVRAIGAMLKAIGQTAVHRDDPVRRRPQPGGSSR